MKTIQLLPFALAILNGFVATGCVTASKERLSRQPTAEDGLIYRSTSEIDKFWLAEGFDFGGFEKLVVTRPELKETSPKDETERDRLTLASQTLPKDMALAIGLKNIFAEVEIQPRPAASHAQSLMLETTIMEFSAGNPAARYILNYGAGMPYIKIQGEINQGTKELFKFQMDAKGKWLGTAFQSGEEIQNGVSKTLADNLATFMEQVSRHEPLDYTN